MACSGHGYFFNSACLQEVASIIVVAKTADDDTAARRGVCEFAVFEVYPHMTYSFPLASLKEYEVAFAQLTFLDFGAIIFVYQFRATLQFHAIHFVVHIYNKSRAVNTIVSVAAITVGSTYPAFNFVV